MKRSRLLYVLAVLTLCFPGCSHKPKPNPISAETEEAFKQRWIAKRMGELQASGQAADGRQARHLALEEFKKQYEYTSAAQKADPMGGSTP